MIAAVTRNSYGSLILNTSDLMFIDIDTPPEPVSARFLRKLRAFIGGRVDAPESRMEKKIIAVAGSLQSEYTLRLYRTFGGFRCAVVNRRMSPDSSESRRLLDAFGADPLYVKLCRNQQSFRARLTPKYWRCGSDRPPSRFPWNTATEEQKYREWEKRYEDCGRQFSTCLFIEQFGMRKEDEELKMLVDLHDRFTKADAKMKLA
jgi:hypothetical protein